MSIKDQLVKRFEDEIQGLERQLRTELPKEIRRARELGDLSENAEYQAAKERQRQRACEKRRFHSFAFSRSFSSVMNSLMSRNDR